MPRVELDAAPRPLNSTHIPLPAPQGRPCIPVFRWDAESGEHAVRQEDETPPRAKQPSRLRDPTLRVAPDARTVLAHRQVEGVVLERSVLGTRFDQGEGDARLALTTPGRLQLRAREVHTHRAGPRPGQ